jgi:sugar/nucleoside kinase (ribokinase family)
VNELDRRTGAERSGVLCLGSTLVDYGKTIDFYPARDALATIEHISRSTGGAAQNMSLDLRRLGADFPIELLGCVADDADGAFILEVCAAAAIETGRMQVRDGATTAFTDVMVERERGRRTFFTYLGTNGLLEVDPRELADVEARILHVGNLGFHPLMEQVAGDGSSGWSRLLAAARAAGIHTNLELATLAPERLEHVVGPCLPHLSSVIINELEASALTGIAASAPDADEPVDWATMEALALGLIERGVSSLAVVHFPAGAVAAAPEGRVWRQGSVRLAADQVVSTTGAGDAFASGVIYGLHEGWTVEACLRLGAAASAACIQDAHTSDGIRPVSECLALADDLGFRPS